ncbi:DUF2975 domain-containing protein [Nibribacter ruber]|uniref:DUF2975 domain-containing protein n=1 Tax=Nibribacter ruber TaxID=2698458 RepID=A0A6P1NX05_9BACT|nr:DUF2975 domain-containing protein [Nibribacter ruber]QHL86844.1 DUF2975 domain-containing protein [Nibribacter ruber]
MSDTNNYLFIGLKIVAWIIFVGLCIEAGGLLVNFIVSLFRPEFVQNLYNTLDLSDMYHHNKWGYFSMYSFILVIAILKAYMFYVVVALVTKLDLTKPFNSVVAGQIRQISYYTFSIGLISYVGREAAQHLQSRGYATDSLQPYWADSQAFILMAAVLYIIATIFRKGLELQTENDLTV